MEHIKVGIREFRENLASYLESSTPVTITSHGEIVGIYIPTRPDRKKRALEGLRRAAAQMEAMMQAAGVTEDEVIEEFEKVRRQSRKAH